MDAWHIDGHKLGFHPARVGQFLEADTWEKAKKVYPLYWEITTSAACNHRCTFCSVDAIGYPAINMKVNALTSAMSQAVANGVKSVMFAGTGEPLLHKQINYIVEYGDLSGLDMAFTTNGVLLDKLENLHKCSWVKISMNAGSPESYAKIHQTKIGDWDKVWDGIRRAITRKGDCTLGVQCVVLPENLHDMRHLASMCEKVGVDYLVLKPYSQGTFSTVQRDLNYKPMDTYLRSVTEFSTDTFKVIYRQSAFQQESEKHQYPKCLATPVAWVYSMADGRVFTCSAHLMDDRFCIGNLNDNTFQEIWEGERRRENWEMMQSFDIAQCRLNCRMDKINKYLHSFENVAHRNFI